MNIKSCFRLQKEPSEDNPSLSSSLVRYITSRNHSSLRRILLACFFPSLFLIPTRCAPCESCWIVHFHPDAVVPWYICSLRRLFPAMLVPCNACSLQCVVPALHVPWFSYSMLNLFLAMRGFCSAMFPIIFIFHAKFVPSWLCMFPAMFWFMPCWLYMYLPHLLSYEFIPRDASSVVFAFPFLFPSFTYIFPRLNACIL